MSYELPGHIAAVDPHPAYQRESEKGAANGYAGLGAGALVPIAQLASGTPTGAKFIRDDGTLQVPSGSASWADFTVVDYPLDVSPTGGGETVADKSVIFVDANNQAYTFNLPAAAAGKWCIIKRYGNVLGSVTIAAAAGDTTEVSSLAVTRACILIAKDATAWYEVAGF